MFLNYLYLAVLVLIFAASVYLRATNPLLQLQLQQAVSSVILDHGTIIVFILYLHHRATWVRAVQEKDFEKNRSDFKAFIEAENVKLRTQLYSFYQEWKVHAEKELKEWTAIEKAAVSESLMDGQHWKEAQNVEGSPKGVSPLVDG